MRGHWLSGTRKLNRHYQSDGGGSEWATFHGMVWGLRGFKVGNDYDEYTTYSGKFEEPSADNISVAPMYHLWDSLPTQYTEELNVPLVYGAWAPVEAGTNKGMMRLTSTAGAWRGTRTVWRYGLIYPDPYWAYGTGSTMGWDTPTRDDEEKNQNGITRPVYPYIYLSPGTVSQPSFETEYSGKTVKIIQPVLELVAIPWRGGLYEYSVVQTDQGFTYTFDNKIRVEGLNGQNRVSGVLQYQGYTLDTKKNPNGNDRYINSAADTWKVRGTGESGAIAWGNHQAGIYFPGDELYVPLAGEHDNTYNMNNIYAGTWTDPDLGFTEIMIYAVRLDHLEVIEVEPANLVLPFEV